ncbi:cysteine-rich domain protein [Aeromicrobium marinum DSM 15272]|uniref:Cysteine-rich domain protein n=1 Tax=Aeromicrobium marinum DSM 15272 TaxID=585531 RepID=E2SF63_9ACTN|nr:heterodisulfide reductase-related iron-sulfur binding cluster [Aeromicrobium marinum]EFQ82148.1 cysteine-rich domain protein [Aeromicrobium marinum DSM 15272]
MQLVAIIVSLAVTAVAIPLTVMAVRSMLQIIRAGKPAPNRMGNPARRTATMFIETFGHTRMIQNRIVGIMHWFVYAAFILLSTAVLQAYFQLFDPEFVWPLIGHFFLYEWAAEGLGLLSTIGIIYLIAVRQRQHPRTQGRKSRFFGSTFWQAYFVEAMALLEGAAILFVRGAEYNIYVADGDPDYASRFHFPISGYLGDAIYPDDVDQLKNIIFFVAMFKIVLAMVWLIVIARNLTMGIAWHRFTAWPNIWFKRESDGGTALGGLAPLYVKGEPLDLEKLEDLEEEEFSQLGVGKVEDFSWKGILDFTTCTECGRCQSQCPAWNTEKPLSPKLLMMGLRDHAYAKIPLLDADPDTLTEAQKAELERPLIGDEDLFGVIDPDVLWSCTNCGACVQQCPVDIEHVDHIDNMRRYQVLVESNFPTELNNIFKGLERKGNPWGMNPRDRIKWTEGLDFEVKQVGVDVESLDEVDWLFWVGCAGAFEDRAKKTTQAVAELLEMAGVSFAVLGDGETCTGDPARRAGNEIVFAQLAMQNAEVFKETKVKKVVSTCAHCFNTLKNEYADYGVELEVVHHTQLLNRLVREGKLTPVASTGAEVEGKKITYHDPCFLGRHNQVYEAPRELLNVIPGATFTEMPRNSERSFCCGAGGARMWMEENIGSRINVNRTEEAVATGADQIAVGCPFCRVMLSDGLTLKQSEGAAREEVEVLDVAQMLLTAVKRVPAMAGAGAAGATEAEPDTADRADDATISDAEEAAPLADAHSAEGRADAEAVAGQSTEELDSPADEGTEADHEAAAAHNVDVDDKGAAHGTPDAPADTTAPATDDEPEPEPAPEPGDTTEPETESVPAADDAPEAPAEESTPEPDADEPVEGDAREEEAEEVTDSAADAPADASEKEKAAWANVGPVNTDLTPDAPAPAATEAEPESEPAPEPAEDSADDSADEPTDEDDEPATESSGEIVDVADAPGPDPVDEDVAELSDANPSGADLSSSATGAVPDEDSEAPEKPSGSG